MSQEVPSLIFHAQALKLIEDLRIAYSGGVGTVDELVAQLQEALNGFQNTMGIPFFDFEPVVDGEPPLSAKINRLWENLQHDVNILQQQADVSRASTVFTHNLISTEILKAQAANARVSNKLKTLQLYSKAVDSSIVTFGDHFRSSEFLDLNMVPPEQQALLLGEGYVTLAQQGELVDLLETASVTVLPTSNGFLGNLHELSSTTRTRRNTTNLSPIYEIGINYGGIDPRFGVPIILRPKIIEGGTTTWEEPVFRAEEEDHGQISAMVDGNKDSWFEYEHCLVSEADRRSANYFNFSFENDVNASTNGESVTTVDWASGPANGVLQLDIELDMTMIDNINYIVYQPFNLADNSLPPVKVVYVQTSVDRTNWEKVLPENVYVSTSANLQVAQHREAIVLGDAIWAFAGRPVRYIQFRLQQENPIQARLGHLYYLDDAGRRVEGPNPPLSDPTRYYDPGIQTVGGSTEFPDQYLQRRESFQGWRWVISVKDITVQRINHSWESTLITKPLRVGGIVDRVTLEADLTIPPEYDASQQWVNFYISPDNGVNWFPISRVQDDDFGIPEIIAFNDPLPAEMREVGVGYETVPHAVTMLRLKAVLTRDTALPSTTPVLHSYRLKVKRR